MDWRYNTIWFEQLPEGEFVPVDFGQKAKVRPDTTQARYLLTRSFKSSTNDFQDLPASDSLLYLEMTLANATSFNGISKLSSLKRIELSHCLKLENDQGLDQIADTLEWLCINQSRKFHIGDCLLRLRNLKVLALNSCAELPSLSFLSVFPNLVDFRFVGTSVADGDLTPILQHPTLCSVGFLDKRNFNLKSSHVDNLMHEKRQAAVTPAYKGKYTTYRYNVVGA